MRFHSPQPDISVNIINHKRIRITSLALLEGIVPYDVIVEDVTKNSGELIYCHPRIINDWNLNFSVREVNDMQSPAGGDTLTILDEGLYEG